MVAKLPTRFYFASCCGSWMPAGTTPAIIARLDREIQTIGQSDGAKRHIRALGIVSSNSTPEAPGTFNRRRSKCREGIGVDEGRL
jgi:tripartite-type tricarboxylate transporter receptor subunit TctC